MQTTMARNDSSGSFIKIFLICVICLAGLMWATVAAPSKHALETHTEAESIINCINKNGPAGKFRDIYDPDKFYLTCQLPDGRWGLAPFARQNGKLWNKTAFVPKDGTLGKLYEYLNGIANKYNGPLPPFGP